MPTTPFEPPIEIAEPPLSSELFEVREAPPLRSAASVSASAQELGFDPDRVSISRRAIYALGALLAGLSLVAFGLGYAVGGAGSGASAAAKQPPAGPFRLDGRLTFQRDGQDLGDEGAVVVVLPKGATLGEKIPITGLSPGDSPPADDHQGVRAIQTLGGTYRRADKEGRFEVTVPTGGKYYLLVLSNNSRRGGDEKIKPAELGAMARFFAGAADLIADRRYAWNELDVEADQEVDYDFSRPSRR